MARRTRTKRKRSFVTTPTLAEMTVDQFMASGFEDDAGSKVVDIHDQPLSKRKPKNSEGTSHLSSLSQLAETDPEFYHFLKDNDQQLLEFGDSGEESGDSDGEIGDISGVNDDDDDLGVPEPKPLHVTSRRDLSPLKDGEDGDSGEDGEGGDSGEDSDGGEDGDQVHVGKTVTQEMVQQWAESIKKTHSMNALKQLSLALHSAIGEMLQKDSSDSVAMTTNVYHLESASVFNSVVLSCLKFVVPCLNAHLPLKTNRTDLPSSHKAWLRVKRIMKPYLCDLVTLMSSLQDSMMQCAVIRHIRSLARYFVSLPKVCRSVDKQLVLCWSTGDHHVQVMAFLALREITLLRPHPSLHNILKKLYLAFVRNCKFTTTQTLSKVRFMQNCLVELLSMDTPTTYQHGFVYIRQLAIHLRAAITSGKKEAQQAVYNWQFVHCLDLWAQVLGHMTDLELRPLVYPLVQVILGTITLQPSPKYYPVRLHLVRTLVELARGTDTYIPSAPYLVEVLESHGTNVPSHLQTGKPPDLSLLLRATKPQLQSRAYQSAVLNGCFELLLQFTAAHSHFIGFPELMFPITTRLRKVAKATPYSWLRLQLQQLVAKVNEVATETERERERVEFSPNQTEKIAVWEQAKKGKDNSISRFLATWVKVHSTKEATGGKGATKRKLGVAKVKPHLATEDGNSAVSDNEEDIVEDFDLSSADSD